jgi:hypothetical protein
MPALKKWMIRDIMALLPYRRSFRVKEISVQG